MLEICFFVFSKDMDEAYTRKRQINAKNLRQKMKETEDREINE